MHPALLEAYMGALPALEAQEQLRAVTTAALGAGTVERSLADQILRDLRRTAGAHTRAERPRDLQDLRQAAGAMGVAVRVQERAEEGPGGPGGTPGTPDPPGALLGALSEPEEG